MCVITLPVGCLAQQVKLREIMCCQRGGLHTFEGQTKKGLSRDIKKHEPNWQATPSVPSCYRCALVWNQTEEERNQPGTLPTYFVRQ